ncbi:MAG: hypothetical protein HQM09_24450 [Candidatus Riflebacteria bacterium]|nr:hypothetical protein [Candidatus Riflebacteria bacterium]
MNAHVETSSTAVVVDKRPTTLVDLINRFELAESRQHPDKVVAVNALRMNDLGNIVVPDLGEFALNEWSTKQTAAMVGLKWDRWFQSSSPEEQAEELNRRFARSSLVLKVRTTSIVEPGTPADGTLTALVSTGFTAIKDSHVAKMLVTGLRSIDTELKIIRSNVTARSCSYVVQIGQPHKVGTGEIGDLAGGLMVCNSGVGFMSLTAVLHITRLICKNGMTAPVADNELLRKRHRGIEEGRLMNMIEDGMKFVPERLSRVSERLLHAEAVPVSDVEETIRGILKDAHMPLRMVAPIMSAYSTASYSKSAFGVSQAITLGAQEFIPEERILLEDVASGYLQRI